MTNTILKLQNDIANSTIDLTTLLRKAQLISNKLNLNDFSTWIDLELNGYDNTDNVTSVPPYRRVTGEIFANTGLRNQKITFDDPEFAELMNNRNITFSIPHIQALISTPGHNIEISLIPQVNQKLIELSNLPSDYTFKFCFGKHELVRIIEIVQNKLMEWSLLLEKNGISGNNLSFSSQEVKIVEQISTIQNYVIYNIFMGDSSNNQFQQGTTNSTQINEM